MTLPQRAAGDPFGAGSHADLVAHAIIANRGARRVTAMAIVIARERRVVTARVANIIMDGIMPVIIVIGVLSAPPAVMRLQGFMRPANTRIFAANYNILPGVTERPDLRRMRMIDARFNR